MDDRSIAPSLRNLRTFGPSRCALHRRGRHPSTAIRNVNPASMIASNLLIRTGHFNLLPPGGGNATSKFGGEPVTPIFRGRSMLNERRETVRHVVNRPAKFQESPVMRECTIRDISSTGVRLVVPGGMAS